MDSRLYLKGLALCTILVGQQAGHAQSAVQWRDSLKTLNKEIAQATTWSTDLHLRKAAVNIELQQWQYALDEYVLILQHETQNPAALFYRGYAATHLRRYDVARRDYEEFLGIFPRHTEARLSLAYVLQKMDRRTDALDQLNIIVEQHPDSAVGYASRAALEQELKQYEAALYDWREAIRLEPLNADYVTSAVSLLLQQNLRTEARRELDAARRRGILPGLLHQWYERVKH